MSFATSVLAYVAVAAIFVNSIAAVSIDAFVLLVVGGVDVVASVLVYVVVVQLLIL